MHEDLRITTMHLSHRCPSPFWLASVVRASTLLRHPQRATEDHCASDHICPKSSVCKNCPTDVKKKPPEFPFTTCRLSEHSWKLFTLKRAKPHLASLRPAEVNAMWSQAGRVTGLRRRSAEITGHQYRFFHHAISGSLCIFVCVSVCECLTTFLQMQIHSDLHPAENGDIIFRCRQV